MVTLLGILLSTFSEEKRGAIFLKDQASFFVGKKAV